MPKIQLDLPDDLNIKLREKQLNELKKGNKKDLKTIAIEILAKGLFDDNDDDAEKLKNKEFKSKLK